MERSLSGKEIKAFEAYLFGEERSAATVEKYLRDVKSLLAFLNGKTLTKAVVLEYKNGLLVKYAATSANSMIAAVNAFFRFLGWHELCVKQFKIQKSAFAM